MSYSDHFRLADDLIAHLDTVLPAVSDPFVESRYTGFLAVSAVTVYELAIKTIFRDFAQGKHKVLACFTDAYFDRINGRIKIAILQDDYIKKYGAKYVEKFKRKLTVREKSFLQQHGSSVVASYGNVITWRNDFAHEGRIQQNATYQEVKAAYNAGKEVIHCLSETMRR